MIIYKATNKINGKVYIGQTSQEFNERRNQHLRNAKRGEPNILYNAIRKYGEENFEWEIIDRCENQKHLDEREIFWIGYYHSFVNDSICNGYNMTIGGGGLGIGENNPNFGKKRSEETKRKISKGNMGKVMSGEARAKMSEVKKGIFGEGHNRYGKTHTDETKVKLSKIKKGVKTSSETKKRMSESHKGKYIGEENHMFGKTGESNHLFGTHLSDETKRKISESKKGRKLSDEHKQKIRDNHSDIYGKNNPMATSVIQLTINGDFINRFDTIAEAVKFIDGDPSCISRCCKGKVKSHKKFKWVYEKDYLDK